MYQFPDDDNKQEILEPKLSIFSVSVSLNELLLL